MLLSMQIKVFHDLMRVPVMSSTCEGPAVFKITEDQEQDQAATQPSQAYTGLPGLL